jgi:hypothetical protein
VGETTSGNNFFAHGGNVGKLSLDAGGRDGSYTPGFGASVTRSGFVANDSASSLIADSLHSDPLRLKPGDPPAQPDLSKAGPGEALSAQDRSAITKADPPAQGDLSPIGKSDSPAQAILSSIGEQVPASQGDSSTVERAESPTHHDPVTSDRTNSPSARDPETIGNADRPNADGLEAIANADRPDHRPITIVTGQQTTSDHDSFAALVHGESARSDPMESSPQDIITGTKRATL